MVQRRRISRLHRPHGRRVPDVHQRDRLRAHALDTRTGHIMQTPASTIGTLESAEDAVARVVDGRKRIREELQKIIVGQTDAVDLVLTALFTGGHCLITGVPGLAKTLLIKTLAEILELSFKRIQFTPDLMPA